MLAFGDTDHDGRYEVISDWRDANFEFSYRIYELQDDKRYTEVYRGGESHIHAVGDLDQDGLSDLVGQWGGTLQIFESPSSDTHPSQLVWTHPSSNILGPVTIADTDRDGKPELIQCQGSTGAFSLIRIFESVGDNDYALVWSYATHDANRLAIGDWDGDGLIEIAYCGQTTKFIGAQMSVIESTADNTWGLIFDDDSGLSSSGEASGGEDTDGNGRIELFFAGMTPELRATAVYEPVADNTFVRVAQLPFDDGSGGSGRGVFGDVDGHGGGEFLQEGNTTILFYRPIAVGSWTVVARLRDPNGIGLHSNARLFDTDQNGIPELFWPSQASDAESTLVFEFDPLATSVPDGSTVDADARFIVYSPAHSIVRMHAPVWVDRIATLAVYDVAGRLVERVVPMREPRDGLVWAPRRLVAGVYFVRAETRDRNPLATRRVVLVR